MPSLVAKRFQLIGRVQGVGCRVQVHELVEGIGHLSGFVRNLPDGSVEVCLKGPDWRMADIEKILREKLWEPVRVDRVEVEELPGSFAPTGFVIRRD